MTVSLRCRAVALLGITAFLASCTVSDSKTGTDTTATTTSTASTTTTTATTSTATPPGGAATSPLSFADLAGTWQMRSVPESGADTSATQSTMTARADSTGWKSVYKNGATLPLHVVVSGDSLIIDTAPHMSVRGRGLMTTTHSVYRREGDRLVGRSVAHYATKSADSVLTLRVEGTRQR